MNKRRIGNTKFEVFPIGLGAMPLSIQGRPSEEQAISVIHAALEYGVELIDTADVYCLDDNDIGHNERLICKALAMKSNIGNIHIATKGGLRRPKGDWVRDGSRKHLRDACEKSLKALGVPSIFLYQLHAPDNQTPFMDSVEELICLQKEGKIQQIGLSNVTKEELKQALSICRIESVQNICNPLQRKDIDNGLIKFCESNQISYLAYSPVGGGQNHQSLAQNSILLKISEDYSVTSYQVILAWLLAKGPNIIPIPGASKVASIRSSASAVGLQLKNEDIEQIDKIGQR